MEPVDLLCSRNARPQKALVGRAQWEINQPPSLKRYRASLEGLSVASLDGRIETSTGAISGERQKSAGNSTQEAVVD
jgi:hypothetical protein